MSRSLPEKIPSLVLAAAFLLAGCGGEPGEPAPAVEEGSAPRIDAAIAKFRDRDPAGAAEILEQVTAREPSSARAWRLLGLARRRQDDLEGALAAYRRSVEADPEELPSVYAAATVHALRGESDEAFTLLTELKETAKYDLSQIPLDDDLNATMSATPSF